ncbi:MAG: hypothetical protein ACK2TV_00665, partial [Anaerolineales bacterium]
MKQIDMLFFIVGNRKRFLILLCLLITSLSACQIAVEQETSQATLTLTDVSPTLTPAVIEPSATAQKSTKLTICTAALPESLFPYDGIDTRVKSNVLELILESPFERVDGQLQPVILEKVPRQADGDLRLEPIPVQAGQPVLDANGDVIVLKPGIQLRPSGCRSGDCVITWDGETPIAMDQMVVVFQLKEQITWS